MMNYAAVGDLWMMNERALIGMLSSPLAPGGGILGMKPEEPKIELVAAENYYTPNDLAWMGIGTQKTSKGLVAVIPIDGVMMPRWSWEGCDTSWVAKQIQIADDNAAVSAIVLKMNTPGGAVNGTAKLAQAVLDCKKPTVGYGEYQVASAGLWVFSQCKETWIDKSNATGVGSLGVMTSLMSIFEKLKKEGIEWVTLRSKGSEDKALGQISEPISQEAIDEAQKIIDIMKVEFLSAVRAKRSGVSEKISAKMFYGKEAISAGFVDARGTLGDAIKRADYLASK